MKRCVALLLAGAFVLTPIFFLVDADKAGSPQPTGSSAVQAGAEADKPNDQSVEKEKKGMMTGSLDDTGEIRIKKQELRALDQMLEKNELKTRRQERLMKNEIKVGRQERLLKNELSSGRQERLEKNEVATERQETIKKNELSTGRQEAIEKAEQQEGEMTAKKSSGDSMDLSSDTQRSSPEKQDK